MSADGPSKFTGREFELAVVERFLDQLENNAGWVAVTGEFGIGKTRLLREVAESARKRGCVVLFGHGDDFDRQRPFGVMADALHADIGRLPDGWVNDLGETKLDAFAGGVSPSGEDRDPDEGTCAARLMSMRALRTLIERIAAPAGLVLLLDDLHWADPLSVEFIASLIRRPLRGPVLTVAAWQGHAPSPLDRVVAGSSHGEGRLLPLRPLSETEAAPLLSKLTDVKLRQAILSEGGGVPFYLEELVRSADRGETGLDDGSRIPPGVAAAVRAELSTLSASTREFAYSGALAGLTFDVDLAREVASLPDCVALDAVDELTAIGMIQALADPRRFTFRQPIVGRAVMAQSPPGWRIGAHARAAQALASRGPRAQAPHVARSAACGDDEAIEILISAAHQVGAEDPALAAEWLGAALRLLPHGHDRIHARVEVLRSLAHSAAGAGNPHTATGALVEALKLIPMDAGPRRVGLIARLSALQQATGQGAAARTRLRDELALAPMPGSGDATALHLASARTAFFAREFAVVRESAGWAVDLARASGNLPALVSGLGLLGLGCVALDDIAAGRAARDEAATLVDRLPDEALHREVDILIRYGLVETILENYPSAVGHLRRSIAIARATNQPLSLGSAQLFLACALGDLGSLPEAADTARASVETARSVNLASLVATALSHQSLIFLAQGDLDAAGRSADEASELAQGVGPRLAQEVEQQRAAVRLESDDAAACLTMMKRAGGPPMVSLRPSRRSNLIEVMVRARLALGQTREAFGLVDMAAPPVEDLPLASGILGRARARILLSEGRADEAARTATAAAMLMAGAGARLDAARASAVAGQALIRAGNRKESMDVLRAALDELRACGAARYEDEVVRDLRRLGQRVRPSADAGEAAAGMAGLSDRERQIAELVATGRTNREMAATLYLSVKTIESHLSHIFTKLEISSRAGLAAAVERSRRQVDSV